jgi:hypothetical protein
MDGPAQEGRMAKRSKLLAAAALAVLAATSALNAQSTLAQAAADECLSKPNGTSPQGSHWFYRVDRANNNRRCWYLGPDGAKARQAAAPRRRSSAARSANPENRGEAAAEQNPIVTDASPSSPALAKPAGTPERAPASVRSDNTDGQAASNPQDGMPAVWPVLTPEDRAVVEQRIVSAPAAQAAQPAPAAPAAEPRPTARPTSEPSINPAHVLAIAAGVLLLVAIFFRAIYKLFAVRRPRQRRPNPNDRWQSAANAGRPRDAALPAFLALAGTAHKDNHARARGVTAAPHGGARNGGLIDAVLQRVHSAEASLSPAQSYSPEPRAGRNRRVAAFG